MCHFCRGAKGMEETKIFLLDLNPASGLGSALREILEINVTPAIYLKEEMPPGSSFDATLPEFAGVVLRFNPAIIFLVLPGGYLKETKKLIHSLKGRPVIAVYEGFKSEDMMELLGMGVADFITPPLQAVNILPRVWRLLEQHRSGDASVHSLKQKIGLKQLVGESPSFVAEVEKIPLIARCDVNVLITGETGTGKELVARAIHYLGPRAGKPFIPTSCGAIPLELIENELFGHVQGAFTGASSSQYGLIHEAHEGTLFLDEIDCLPPFAQVKFLRFLQEKEYKQLGSAKVHHADIRIIAATNTDLENAVKDRRFREDLYYRLNIIPLALPPLRERPGDIPLLARHMLEKYASEFNKEVQSLSPEVLQKLMVHDWPGNVRELENVIERAVVFCKKSVIEPPDVLLPSREAPSSPEPFREAKARIIERFERNYIQGLLAANQGNISRAAKLAMKNRRAFWELIRKYKINTQGFRSSS